MTGRPSLLLSLASPTRSPGFAGPRVAASRPGLTAPAQHASTPTRVASPASSPVHHSRPRASPLACCHCHWTPCVSHPLATVSSSPRPRLHCRATGGRQRWQEWARGSCPGHGLAPPCAALTQPRATVGCNARLSTARCRSPLEAWSSAIKPRPEP